jgi:hypothetical protein
VGRGVALTCPRPRRPQPLLNTPLSPHPPPPPPVVTRVAQDADGVTLTAADGAAFRAPHALVTLPLGVLKDPAAVAFDPPLPRAKAAAVNDMVRADSLVLTPAGLLGCRGAAYVSAGADGVGFIMAMPSPPSSPSPNPAKGFGVLDKLVMVWDEPWWPANFDFISRELTDWSGKW